MPKIEAELTVTKLLWKGPHEHVFTLSDGRTITVDHPCYIGWDTLAKRSEFVMLNLGTGDEQPVPNRIPTKIRDAWLAAQESYFGSIPPEPHTVINDKAADETVRRAGVWGWKKGKHETSYPAPAVGQYADDDAKKTLALHQQAQQESWDETLRKDAEKADKALRPLPPPKTPTVAPVASGKKVAPKPAPPTPRKRKAKPVAQKRTPTPTKVVRRLPVGRPKAKKKGRR